MKTTKNNHRMLLALASVLLAGLVAGCAPENPTEVEDYDPQASLFAYIYGGRPASSVTLEWVGRFGGYYDRAEQSIDDAEILLFAVPRSDGQPSGTINADTLRFSQATDEPWRYDPVRDDYMIHSRTRYRIEVRKPSEGVELWSEATVPDTFSLELFQAGELLYAANGDSSEVFSPADTIALSRNAPVLFSNWSEAWAPSEAPGGYVLTIYNLEEYDSTDSTTWPLRPDYDPEKDWEGEDGWEVEPRVVYTIAPDFQTESTIAWLFFSWAGITRVDVQAASNDYYRYVFTGLTGGDPNNPQSPEMNIKGGLGLFGATRIQSFYLELLRASEEGGS